MKKIFVCLMFTFAFCANVWCQINVAGYTALEWPVKTSTTNQQKDDYDIFNSNGSSYGTQTYQEPSVRDVQTVSGYFINSRNALERVSIKIAVYRGVLGIISVYNKSARTWMQEWGPASEVSYSAPDVIKENFTYEAYTSNYGKIYF